MEPSQPDETPTHEHESPALPAPKPYLMPKLTEHGKLPALTLGASLTDS
jgi:hypothetical protein